MSSAPARPYVSNGQVLQSPPLTARVRNFVNGTYDFLGLYFSSLLSLDAYAAAEASSFNIRNRSLGARAGARYGLGGNAEGAGVGTGGGGGGGGGSGTGGAGPGRKLGVVDDIRGPECTSCG